jgi:hypothetical protein
MVGEGTEVALEGYNGRVQLFVAHRLEAQSVGEGGLWEQREVEGLGVQSCLGMTELLQAQDKLLGPAHLPSPPKMFADFHSSTASPPPSLPPPPRYLLLKRPTPSCSY